MGVGVSLPDAWVPPTKRGWGALPDALVPPRGGGGSLPDAWVPPERLGPPAEQRAAAEAARADEAFAELDSDGDGQVTVAELRLRPELDTDGDGAVSEDEAQALMGDTTPLDAAAFRDRLWATLRERYRPQVGFGGPLALGGVP
ncbi:hypothetical protein AV530_008434 [Patagioenas fasciata monilis]|uniref:EF-hand domain-containing protein n=1 Tax=Patagioenas fasciata monilis TaxID=372326 RepID=A0A1V4KDI0_PATFA|nr:hypothetical protein AV530_008434 [Patagioenas fasciata monilis]